MLYFNTGSSRFSLQESHSRLRTGDCIRHHNLHMRWTLRYVFVISSSPSKKEQGTDVCSWKVGHSNYYVMNCKSPILIINLLTETFLRSYNSLTDSRIQLSQQNLTTHLLFRWEKIHGTFYSLVHPQYISKFLEASVSLVFIVYLFSCHFENGQFKDFQIKTN